MSNPDSFILNMGGTGITVVIFSLTWPIRLPKFPPCYVCFMFFVVLCVYCSFSTQNNSLVIQLAQYYFYSTQLNTLIPVAFSQTL